jgi:hypothetical protein
LAAVGCKGHKANKINLPDMGLSSVFGILSPEPYDDNEEAIIFHKKKKKKPQRGLSR